MLKICRISGISKIKFFNFSGTEKVKAKSKTKIKTIRNYLSLQVNYFSSNFNKSRTFFSLFTENLTLSHRVPSFEQQYLGNGKTKHILYTMFFKEYSISFPVISRLKEFALVVL